MMCAVCSFICITVLVLLTCPSAYRSAVPRPETLERREREADQLQQLGASALNTASAFEPYRDPASRTATEPDVQQQHQHNILFSPSCLGSALAQLCPVSGSDSQSRPWRPRGWWPEHSLQATISALTDLQCSLLFRREGAEVGFRRQRLGLEPGQMLGLVVPQQEWQIGAQADDGAKERTRGQLRLHSSYMLMDDLHYTMRICFPGLMKLSPLSSLSALRLGGKTCRPRTNLYLTIMCISKVAYNYISFKD